MSLIKFDSAKFKSTKRSSFKYGFPISDFSSFRTIAIIGFAAASLVSLSNNVAAAQVDAAGKDNLSKSSSSKKNPLEKGLSKNGSKVEISKNAEDKKNSSQVEKQNKNVVEVSLADLKDVGLVLQTIREQSVNIYEEATRRPISVDEGPEIKSLHSIPVMQPDKNFLPSRREWLLFYIASMEPVIKLLEQDVQEAQTGVKQLVIPHVHTADINPLWEQWAATVHQLNLDLSALVPLVDDAENNNQEIAAVAVRIFNDSEKLESIRRSIYFTVQKSIKEPAK